MTTGGPFLRIRPGDYNRLEHKDPSTLYQIDPEADPIPPTYGQDRWRLRIILEHGVVLTTGPLTPDIAVHHAGELRRYQDAGGHMLPPYQITAQDGTTTTIAAPATVRAWQTEPYPEDHR